MTAIAETCHSALIDTSDIFASGPAGHSDHAADAMSARRAARERQLLLAETGTTDPKRSVTWRIADPKNR